MINKALQSIILKLHLERYVSTWLILAIDTTVSIIASCLTLVLVRHSFLPSFFSFKNVLILILASGISSLIFFNIFKTFRSVIRHSTLRELWKIGAASIGKISLMSILFVWWSEYQTSIINLSYMFLGPLLDGLFTITLLISIRIAMIVVYDTLKLRLLRRRDKCKQVIVYGTGDKQLALMIRLQNSPTYNVIGFLTYGQKLKLHTIAGLPVYYFEKQEDIEYLAGTMGIDAVLIAENNTVLEEKERLIKYCSEEGIKVLIAPPIDEVIDGRVMKQNIREINIEDLLGRPEIKISLTEIQEDLSGKTILVTGAAGSIGSELCRQLAEFGIGKLILFDNAESPMHNIRLELEERFPNLQFVPVVGDIRVNSRIDFAFRNYKPQVVFHAAAYKHVPLMEENPCEAAVVNVAGTRNIANHCIKYGIEKMVMISTDKAVNPTNVMGASKRMAEIYVQSLGQAIKNGKTEGKTKFITTRFGNVLGSNGSVIPRFREQIGKGGPVTVTHPDITRFFMTIPEACRLVMEAAILSDGNEIFVFDMGESVKISDLAKRMIELAGFHVDKDIKIEYTGLRPGEKLYEEVLANTENTLPTTHEKIRIANVRECDYEYVSRIVDELDHLARAGEVIETVRLMKSAVPEFISKNSRFEELDVKKLS